MLKAWISGWFILKIRATQIMFGQQASAHPVEVGPVRLWPTVMAALHHNMLKVDSNRQLFCLCLFIYFIFETNLILFILMP